MSSKPALVEPPREHVCNALQILLTAAVREGGSVRYDEADVEMVIRRLRAAASSLEVAHDVESDAKEGQDVPV